MSISSKIADLTRAMSPSGRYQIIDYSSPLLASDFLLEIRMCECKLNRDQEVEFLAKIYAIEDKLKEFGRLQDRTHDTADYADSEEERDRLELEIPEMFFTFKKQLKKFVEEEVRISQDGRSIFKLSTESAPWIKQMNFAGAAKILAYPHDYIYKSASKTTKQIILQKKDWVKEKFAAQANFVVGVVNCRVQDLENTNVSTPTFERASASDLEVFDGIHEIERMFGLGSFKLGIIEVDEGDKTVKNYYNLRYIILRHCRDVEELLKLEGKKLTSVGIVFIAESNNLVKDGVANIEGILSEIPFDELRQQGIAELNLEIISCNTIEISPVLIKKFDEIAKTFGIKITGHFYSGYVHNNITYCYLDDIEFDAVREEVLSGKTRLPQKLFDEETKTKKSRLMQVILPGFSNIDVADSEKLSSYVCQKVTQRGSISDVASTAQKKLLIPHEDVPLAVSWKYEVYPQRQLTFLKPHPTENRQIEVALPMYLQMHGKRLISYAAKEKGGSIGGFYFDGTGKRYLVKFSDFLTNDGQPQEITAQRQYSSALFDYHEILLNRLSREILGPDYAAKDTQIAYYDIDGGGKRGTCFVSPLIPGYRDISDLPASEKKGARQKFHSSYVFNCFIANSDIYDENLGLDADGHPVNVDLGLKPSFLFEQQKGSGHNGKVDQLASFIAHQNYLGGQKFRREYFGYDQAIDPLTHHEENLESDINYYEIIAGVKNILDKKAQIQAAIVAVIAEISNDQAIELENRARIIGDFYTVKAAFEQRIQYLQHYFGADVARLDVMRDSFKEIRWRHHPKYQEILARSQEFETKMAQEEYGKNLFAIAQIIGIADFGSDEELRAKIIATDLRQISSQQKAQLQKFATDNFILPIAVMNNDLAMTQWLVDNDIADVTKRYNQRNFNYHFCPETPLSIAIGMHNDKLLYGQDKAAMKEMIDYLQGKFFDERKLPGVTTTAFESSSKNPWPLRMTKMLYSQYCENQQNLEGRARKAIADTIVRVRKDKGAVVKLAAASDVKITQV